MSSHQTRLSNPRNYALIALVVLLVLAGVAIDGPATLSTLKTAHSQQTTTKITPTSFPAPTDAMIPGWKKYTNNKDGYSIDAPSSWFAESFDYTNPNQIYNINFSFFPSAPNTSPSTPQTSFINIANPIAFTDYFKGSGHPALITETIYIPPSEVTPPPGYVSDGPCYQCSGKTVYIDLQNGKFLEIDAGWGNARSDFEATFDKTVSTLRFTHAGATPTQTRPL